MHYDQFKIDTLKETNPLFLYEEHPFGPIAHDYLNNYFVGTTELRSACKLCFISLHYSESILSVLSGYNMANKVQFMGFH